MKAKMTVFFDRFLNVAVSLRGWGINLMRIAILIIFV